MIPDKPKTRSVANWYGSNRMLAAHVGRAMQGCTWVGVPFAGGMSELLYINARTFGVNDRHAALINLARCMSHPQLGPKLYREMRRRVFHPSDLVSAQDRCTARERSDGMFSGFFQTETPNPFATKGLDFEWAADYFVCQWMGRGGKGGTDGELKSGLPLRWDANGGGSAKRFFSASSSIVAWRKILRRCEFSTLDAFEFLDTCWEKEQSLEDECENGIYCDPPFPGPGDQYIHQLIPDSKDTRRGQEKLAKSVSRFVHTRVVMRFYDVPLIRELYPTDKWSWLFLTGRKQTNDLAAEVLLINRPGMEFVQEGGDGSEQ